MWKKKIYFYSRQKINENDIEKVSSVLRSDSISQGPRLNEFEDMVAEYCGAKYCVAVSNGTAALHVACKVLGLGDNDIGWTSPLSFVATANSMRYCGANVDFIDIDLSTFNICQKKIKEKFEHANKINSLPKVLIPVHFAGQSCDIKKIKNLADDYGCKIIEDACHAMGGEYDSKKIGCCQYSDITVFSLHPVKSITSGEGGLVLTNNEDIYKKVKQLRAHGIVKGSKIRNKSVGPWHSEMQTEGFNYKITEFQCALGTSQLTKLDYYIKKRRLLAQRYKEKLKGLPIKYQASSKNTLSAWHLFVILIDFDHIDKIKLEIFEELRKKGINLSVNYYPIHLHPFYNKLGFNKGMFPNAEEYYEKAFVLPLHPGLEIEDIDYIADELHSVLL